MTDRIGVTESSEERSAGGPSTDAALLQRFLADRRAPCPGCGFELHRLLGNTCPECGTVLELRLDRPRPRIGLLVLALAPGIFSATCAVILGIPLVNALLFLPRSTIPAGVVFAEAVGISSGIVAAWLFRHRWWFVDLPRSRQWWIIVAVASVHFLCLGTLILLGQ